LYLGKLQSTQRGDRDKVIWENSSCAACDPMGIESLPGGNHLLFIIETPQLTKG